MPNIIPKVPNNEEAEAALIGSVLINPDAYFDVADITQPEDFYFHRHRWIWEAIESLGQKHCALDLLTVCNELERGGKLVEVGGPAYLADLIGLVPTSLHAPDYARLVTESSIRRHMLQAANEIAKTAYREDTPIEEALNEVETSVLALSSRKVRQGLSPAANVVNRLYDQLSDPKDEPAVPTGFSDLDKLLSGGQRKADLIVVAGRPGMGKTGFLLSIIKHALIDLNRRVALFSLEMDEDGMIMRLLSQVSDIPLERLRLGQLLADDWDAYTQASEKVSEARLFIDDTPIMTPSLLRTRCRRLQVDHGLDLVVVDYLQLMSGGGRFENRILEVSHISRNLKLIARELKVPVLAAAQLSRAVEQRNDKRPVLADLRESGAIEQDGDVIMFLYRPELYDETAEKGLAKLILAKQRNGPVGEIDLIFRSQLTRFDNDMATSGRR